jgi:predicted alpha-1,2-mannosidase
MHRLGASTPDWPTPLARIAAGLADGRSSGETTRVMLAGERVWAGAIAVCLVAALAGGARVASAATVADLAALVDPFVGTDGNGHTFPGAAGPFGMVQFSPVTVGGGAAGYRYSERRLRGFAVTRLSGSGCTNYGDVPLMPTTSPPRSSPVSDPGAFTAGFSHRDEVATPGSYQVRLDSGISVGLTVTARTGLGVFGYPIAAAKPTILIAPSGSANHQRATVHVVGRNLVEGSATSAAFGGACGHPHGRYTVYFVLEFERPFAGFGVWSGGRLAAGARQETGAGVGAYVSFSRSPPPGPVRVKAGISFVSIANAQQNLAAEATSWNFTETQARARASWNRLLARIRVSGGTHAEQENFYTALYHALLQPSIFSDVNGEYLGLDGKVQFARGYTQYANFSEWDTYRGQVQLLALLAPQQASDIVRSLLADGQQLGRLPRWPVAAAETGLMIGDPSDLVIADAYAFGAHGFDAALALRAMVAGAASPRERPGLAAYLKLGYIPGAAATTLEYSTADFAISQLAAALGDAPNAQAALTRSDDWRQTFNQQNGFVEPRLADGTFPAGIDPASTNGFVEGDAWQYTFMVPQDMGGLLGAIGSPAAARQRLDAFFAKLNAGPSAPHAWLGNEPSFLAPYAYLWLGTPWRSEEVVRRALTTLFQPSPTGLPGNDDLGAISAWYVWGALGLYPAIPAAPGLAVVGPLFARATITLANGRATHISATGGRYVRSLLLNGKPYSSSWLPLSEIATGGTLTFIRSPSPGAWATAPTSVPPSFPPGATPR